MIARLLGFALILVLPTAALAQPVADFYRGNQGKPADLAVEIKALQK